jgi:hypothetical protein
MKLSERGSYFLAFGLCLSALVASTVVVGGINTGNPYFKWIPPTISPGGQPVPETGASAITFFELYCDGKTRAKVVLPSNRRDWTAPVGSFTQGVLHVCTMKTKYKNGGSTQTAPVSFTIPVTR